ncbi:unnamed protein product [Owenia fusiformis]|uniref:Fork-head domain-containing protein n=1 Tax=Owenia fusiformis TaxID=6347 RepID=A0A8S4N4Q2_OWEFU|nr:unnamed protein product [Owenia fusiformis]
MDMESVEQNYRKHIQNFVRIYEKDATENIEPGENGRMINIDETEQPRLCPAELAFLAMLRSPTFCLPVYQIFSYVRSRFPYYKKMGDHKWESNIRKVLTKTSAPFRRLDIAIRPDFWTFEPEAIMSFARGDMRYNKFCQREANNNLRWAWLQVPNAQQIWSKITECVHCHITSSIEQLDADPEGYVDAHHVEMGDIENSEKLNSKCRTITQRMAPKSTMKYLPTYNIKTKEYEYPSEVVDPTKEDVCEMVTNYSAMVTKSCLSRTVQTPIKFQAIRVPCEIMNIGSVYNRRVIVLKSNKHERQREGVNRTAPYHISRDRAKPSHRLTHNQLEREIQDESIDPPINMPYIPYDDEDPYNDEESYYDEDPNLHDDIDPVSLSDSPITEPLELSHTYSLSVPSHPTSHETIVPKVTEPVELYSPTENDVFRWEDVDSIVPTVPKEEIHDGDICVSQIQPIPYFNSTFSGKVHIVPVSSNSSSCVCFSDCCFSPECSTDKLFDDLLI